MGARSPDQIDLYVARQIERRRLVLGLSQTELARGAGVSFQQIQKYEGGVNRIAASRIYRIAAALGCAPGDLFPQKEPTP